MDGNNLPSLEQLRDDVLRKLKGSRATANYLGMCLGEKYSCGENEMAGRLVPLLTALELEGALVKTPDWKQFYDVHRNVSDEIRQRFIPYILA